MQDAIVLGCGISGMAAARVLTDQGLSVTILDEYAEPGGNHISRDFGPFSFDIGAIFLWGGNAMARLFPECTAEWAPVTFGIERLAPSGEVLRYPFDPRRELFARPPAYVARVFGELFWQRLAGSRTASTRSFARYYLGDTLLADSGLANYLSRFYGLPIDAIGFDLARRRMRWIAENGSIRRRAAGLSRRTAERIGLRKRSAKNGCFVRPRAGFPAMYCHVTDALARGGTALRLGAAIEGIATIAGGFEVRTAQGSVCARRLVSTVPLGRMAHFLGQAGDGLPDSMPLMTLCIRFRGTRGFRAPILYNFHDRGMWKRLTMHSDYYGEAEGSEYFSVEVPLLDPGRGAAECYDDFRGMTAEMGLFAGEMEMVGHLRTDFAYPLYDLGAKAKRDAALDRMHALGIETVGRQGNFDYIPVASEAVRLAREQLGPAV